MFRGKTIVAGIGVLLVVAAGVGFAYRDTIAMMLFFIRAAPDHAFTEAAPPAAPDYTDPSRWAAHPDRDDLADTLPAGDFSDRQPMAAVDVFFVHPTTFYTSDHWNQPLDNAEVNAFTDVAVMQGQASAFNGCCRVYAPRYRQATIFAFVDENGNGEAALDLAYGDVVAAFRHFIEHLNDGRPFIVAGHSQGSRHLDILLREEIVGSPLADRLVAAYPIGFPIDQRGSLPICKSTTDTGCQVTWNSVGPAITNAMAAADDICVNPLTWSVDGAHASHDRNPGAVNFNNDGQPEPGIADAQCRAGNLLVSEIRSQHYGARPLGPDNYHIYDYAFFYLSIRENAAARVKAFLADY